MPCRRSNSKSRTLAAAAGTIPATVRTRRCTPARAAGPVGDYWQGGGWPFEQTTVVPGGTTMVVLFLGGGGLLLLKLRQPLSPRGRTNSIRRSARMAIYLTQ